MKLRRDSPKKDARGRAKTRAPWPGGRRGRGRADAADVVRAPRPRGGRGAAAGRRRRGGVQGRRRADGAALGGPGPPPGGGSRAGGGGVFGGWWKRPGKPTRFASHAYIYMQIHM